MAREFKLPDLGEGIHEGEVIAVLVSVGDSVKEGDPILEVETDKAAVEIPSPFTGTVEAIRVKPGEVIKVGDVLIVFSDADATAPVAAAPAAKAARVPVPTDRAADERPDRRLLQRPADSGPVPAAPSTRRLARELGVDLKVVPPTGPEGLVTAADVRQFAEAPRAADPDLPESEAASAEAVFGPAPPLPDFSRWGPVEAVPLRSIRKATARQMTLAWSQIPHIATQDDIDVTRLEALRRRNKERIAAAGGHLTLTVFAVKAAAAALKRFPQFNVSVDTANGRIIRKDYCHVGVATNTDQGLVVPVIRDADRKSIIDIARELNDLVRRARARKIKLEELQGGTFTITNTGAAGGRGHFAPIINYPEAAILGMSSAGLKPVVRKDRTGAPVVVPRLIMPVVLSMDHRVLDGMDSLRFMAFLRRVLENPDELLLAG
jgi:pyruvate dehydrogenase E2 component (dihydrolipoamide acetyltransferase)